MPHTVTQHDTKHTANTDCKHRLRTVDCNVSKDGRCEGESGKQKGVQSARKGSLNRNKNEISEKKEELSIGK